MIALIHGLKRNGWGAGETLARYERQLAELAKEAEGADVRPGQRVPPSVANAANAANVTNATHVTNAAKGIS